LKEAQEVIYSFPQWNFLWNQLVKLIIMKDSKESNLANDFPQPPESKLAELELRESKDLLQSVFDTSLIQMSVMKAVRDARGSITDFRILLTNRELERETGRTDLVGKYYLKEYPGVRASGLFDVMLRVMETGKSERIEYFYPYENFNKWYSSMFVKLDDGLVSTNLDITERKRVEEKSLKNLTLLEQTEKLAKSGSWDYDILTKNFWWSDGMYRIFQIPKGTVVTPSIYLDYVMPEDRETAERLVRSISETNESCEEIIKLRIEDQIKTIKIKCVPVVYAEKYSDKVLGIDIDLTASIHAIEVLAIQNHKLFKSKELLRKKDEFINIASHELKTPVTSIKAYAEILQEKFEETGDVENASFLQKMNVQINRLSSLIGNLLDTSKISEGEMSLSKDNFDLNALIDERVEELQRLSAKHKLRFEGGSLKPLIADRERIGQVLTNIIINAIKYSPDGGEIFIKTASTDDGIEVSIQDNGIGIPSDWLNKIFDRFTRVDTLRHKDLPGLGLGLYISAGIIQSHRGRISVVSEVGTGSKFTIFLPGYRLS
jgi:signal transduction histidine kinase